MNDRERAICARVKEFRERIKWPQTAFAKELAISRDKLASIEYARTPLSYKVGTDLCEVFDLSGQWLVTGRGAMQGGSPVLWDVEFPFGTHGKSLFSEVYDKAPQLFKADRGSVNAGIVPLLAATPGFDPEAYMHRVVRGWFRSTKVRDPYAMELLVKELCDLGDSLLKDMARAGALSRVRLSKIIEDHKAAEESKKRDLTNTETSSSVASVKAQLPILLEELKEKTAEPGKKTKLAKFLGAPLASVSRWLSGEREPGGEIVLQMQAWLKRPNQ